MMPLFDPSFYENEQQENVEKPVINQRKDYRLAIAIGGILLAFIIFVYMAT